VADQHEQLPAAEGVHPPLAWRHLSLSKRVADKGDGKWLDVGFHFLESVEFYKPGPQADTISGAAGRSVVRWNDIVFRNFSKGNLKALDFHLFAR